MQLRENNTQAGVVQTDGKLLLHPSQLTIFQWRCSLKCFIPFMPQQIVKDYNFLLNQATFTVVEHQ